jgi:hypothetical protein
MMGGVLRLRAQITIDLAATDFVQAADHQNRLAEFLSTLKLEYPTAELIIRERRVRKPDLQVIDTRVAPIGLRNAKIG